MDRPEVSAVTDLVTFGEAMCRLSPRGQERLEAATAFEVRAAGAAGNVAVAADRLGTTATLLTRLPENPIARRVVGELHQCGVETDVTWSRRGRVGVYYHERAGEPRGSNVVYDRAGSAFAAAEPDEFDRDRIRDARAFFASGITPALSARLRETTAELLATAGRAGTTTAFDVNYREQLWAPEEARSVLSELFPAVDVLLVAEREARTLFGFDGDPRQLAHKLGSNFDLTTVVVTRGDQGALAWHDSVVHDQPAVDTDTVERIGSGDAFAGAFLARRLSGDDVDRSLEYANATAALKRTIPGDVARVEKSEVEALISNPERAITR